MQDPKPLVAAACLSFVPSACAHPTAPAPSTETKTAQVPVAPTVAGIKPGIVDGATGRKLVEAGVAILDVRTPREFEMAHVPGAKNIPVDEVASRASEIGPRSTPVLVYCRSGHRSGMAREVLQRLGFSSVYDMQTLSAWEQSSQ